MVLPREFDMVHSSPHSTKSTEVQPGLRDNSAFRWYVWMPKWHPQ